MAKLTDKQRRNRKLVAPALPGTGYGIKLCDEMLLKPGWKHILSRLGYFKDFTISTTPECKGGRAEEETGRIGLTLTVGSWEYHEHAELSYKDAVKLRDFLNEFIVSS